MNFTKSPHKKKGSSSAFIVFWSSPCSGLKHRALSSAHWLLKSQGDDGSSASMQQEWMASSDLQERAESPPPSLHLLLERSLKYHSALGRKDPFVPKLFPSKSPAESAPFFYLQPLLLPTLKTIFCKPKFLKLQDWLLSWGKGKASMINASAKSIGCKMDGLFMVLLFGS